MQFPAAFFCLSLIMAGVPMLAGCAEVPPTPATAGIDQITLQEGKAVIEGRLVPGGNVCLSIGEGPEGWAWSSQSLQGTHFKAVVEISETIKLDNGALGSGLVFTSTAETRPGTGRITVTSYIHIPKQGDAGMPSGVVTFRSDKEVKKQSGVCTFADITLPDGTTRPISLRVGPSRSDSDN